MLQTIGDPLRITFADADEEEAMWECERLQGSKEEQIARAFRTAVLTTPHLFIPDGGRAIFRHFSERLRDFDLTEEDKLEVQRLAYSFMVGTLKTHA